MNRPAKLAPKLLLRCLGHVRLADRAGSDLTPRGRKARALLAYLALSGRPSSRERLADLLWSDRGPEQARSSFRQAVFELRHLADANIAVSMPGRDELSLNAALITTDLAAIRIAAETGDYDGLRLLLSEADAGLASDLDGLDPEYDVWLQVQRAHEPAQTLGVALVAAEHCLDTDGPQQANRIVAELQRLDPCSEEAARLAFHIADRLGDRASLHRHFEVLRDRLLADYAAAPSRETSELFHALAGNDARPAVIADHAGDAATPETVVAPPPVPESARPGAKPWLALAAVLLLAVVGALAWNRWTPSASPAELPLVAVLPFDQQNDTSQALAEGLWDDTRLALSQNRAVRVLGRTTSMAIDAEPGSPQSLHKRLGIDYLLEGGVRNQGERVRIVVSLTRASDGVSVWEQGFEGRLGDAMALQNAVAQGIEGRIRGRLAPGGGVHARQITTTPRVYALYSEARALIRNRGTAKIKEAAAKLKQAVALDPNYAPAWASLATTARINRHSPEGLARDQVDALAAARRAIDLAPNLAEAHAALALVQGDHLPSSERLLKRALQLDPANGEAWNWLGNGYANRGLWTDAVTAWERGVAADPLFASPAVNLLQTRLDRGEHRAAEALIGRIARVAPASPLVAVLRADVHLHAGDYSGAAALLRERAPPDRWTGSERSRFGNVLIRLDYIDEAGQLWTQPEWFGPVLRGERLPPDRINGRPVGARDFWLTPFFGIFAGRAMLLQDRPDLLVRAYRQGFSSRDDFLNTLDAADTLGPSAPNLAVALRRTGANAEADAILAATGQLLNRRLTSAPYDSTRQWELAKTRAQQGRHGEALTLLLRARRGGWLPDGGRDALDIAREPSLEPLRHDPRFQAIRQRILAHIARERKELGPVRL